MERPLISGAFMVSMAVLIPTLAMAAEQQPAASEEILLLKEETVSISAAHEQPISEAASNVYVITDEDIQHSGATDIPTLLRRIPGMEVMQMTGADFNVGVRGDNQVVAHRLLVLVDGRSIYEDSFGSVFWTLIPVTLPEIKRIEVLKGPASAIYGFNAFDGVVNIITKSPDEMKGTTAQFGGGEFGTIRSAVVQAGTIDKFGYRLSIGHDQNQKWSDRDSLALRANKFNVQTEYALSGSSKLVFTGGLVDSNRFDGQVFDVVHEESTIANGYANLEYRRGGSFVRANWIRWDENRLEVFDQRVRPFAVFTDAAGNVNEPTKEDVFNLEGQHVQDLTSTNHLTYGFNYRHNAISLNVLDRFTRENRFGLYFQDEWHATKTFMAVAGLRWDIQTMTGKPGINPTYSPRVALLYKPIEDHTFRLAGSVAYRPPNVIDTHLLEFASVPPTPFTPIFVQVGRKDLKPEKIVSYEAGYQGWYFKHRLRVRLDVFYHHLTNLIGGTATADPFVVTEANFGINDVYGGEAGVEFLATSWLTGFMNYSVVERWQSTNLVGQFTDHNGPPYKINAGLRGEWDNGISGEAVVHHVAASSWQVSSAFPAFGFTVPTNIGSYTLLNGRIAYHFWRERAEVAASVFNALNDHHRENPVGDPIGSRVMGWVTIRY